MEQLRHHRSHAAKMARARCSIQPLTQARNFDKGAGACGIHLFCRRSKHQINTRSLEYLGNPLQASGIGGEVFFGAKLGGVYEDGNRHRIAACLRGAHQREMALVQRSHGRHQPQGLACRADTGARASWFQRWSSAPALR